MDDSRNKHTRDVSCMNIDKEIGSGVYGAVFRATDRTTHKSVALKMVKMKTEKHGFPVTAMREIKILKSIKHENIISLLEILSCDEDSRNAGHGIEEGAVFMVLELMDFNLSTLIASKHMTLSHDHIRCYAKQLLSGVKYMHQHKILHRDIKGANILIGRDNRLKIADWGLARSYLCNSQRMTGTVVTLWYRCPELLLESRRYGPEVDMWSVGCVMVEMMTRDIIWPGRPKKEIDQLEAVYELCGSPTGSAADRLKLCEGWEKYQISKEYPCRIRERFEKFPANVILLLEELLCLNPDERISAAAAMDHVFFTADGGTLPPYRLPLVPTTIAGTCDGVDPVTCRETEVTSVSCRDRNAVSVNGLSTSTGHDRKKTSWRNSQYRKFRPPPPPPSGPPPPPPSPGNSQLPDKSMPSHHCTSPNYVQNNK